jgi:hypothetical protein
MLKIAALILLLALIVAASCAGQDSSSGNSLIPKGFRAIATPDDSAIILVSDTTNGTGKGLAWLGVGGAIACDADNSIIVWSRSYAPPMPAPPPAWPGPMAAPPPPGPMPMPGPPVMPPAPVNNQQFLWPEGIENAVPFDLDNSIILMGD